MSLVALPMTDEDLIGYSDEGVPNSVLKAWGFEAGRIDHVQVGHINQTFRVSTGTSGAEYVLQRLNPMFGPAVHYDIEAITERLEARGLVTPRLLRTRSNELWHIDGEGGLWRVMTWIDGRNISAVDSPLICHEAGLLVARFHLAVKDFKYEFRNQRVGVHDTSAHVRRLVETLESHDFHKLHADVKPLAEEAMERLKQLPSLEGLPERIVHGDLKINNLIFTPEEEGLCLIDLDTLGHMNIAVELGDALRSWCNPTGESRADSEFAPECYQAALEGYAEGGGTFLCPEEINAIPVGVETIALELTVRFLTDALQESYFGWDRVEFASAGHHNLHRAKSQLSFARSFAAQKDQVLELTRAAFSTRKTS